MKTNKKLVVLITGTSRGIGQAIADRLNQEGHTVYGTSRDTSQKYNYPFTTLFLDLSKEESIQNAIRTIVNKEQRIDVLINNAGYHLHGAALESSDEELRLQLEANFFGAVKLMREAVPFMIEQKGGGKVINVSSVGGRFGVPFASAYAASKFALEGFSESLRYELLKHKVFVSLIEPGYVNTGTLSSSIVPTKYAHPLFETMRHAALKNQIKNSKTKGSSVQDIANVVSRIINSEKPNFRYAIGGLIPQLRALQFFLPQNVFEKMIVNNFQINK